MQIDQITLFLESQRMMSEMVAKFSKENENLKSELREAQQRKEELLECFDASLEEHTRLEGTIKQLKEENLRLKEQVESFEAEKKVPVEQLEKAEEERDKDLRRREKELADRMANLERTEALEEQLKQSKEIADALHKRNVELEKALSAVERKRPIAPCEEPQREKIKTEIVES